MIYTTPISSKNHDPTHSIPVPQSVLTTLGLSKTSLVVWNDLNRFVWVGPDVEFKSNEQPYYGNVGQDFWNSVRKKVLAAAVAPTIRTE